MCALTKYNGKQFQCMYIFIARNSRKKSLGTILHIPLDTDPYSCNKCFGYIYFKLCINTIMSVYN